MAGPQSFFLKQGNTLPIITATLVDASGNVANLTGASVHFHMTNPFHGNVINAAATIVNATLGQVSYAWQTGDTNNTGTYSCEWYVVFASGAQETYPQGYYNTVQIDPSLTSGFIPVIQSTPLFNTIWNSTSAPTSIQGNNGDYWFNTTTNFFYGPKSAGAWPSGFSINPGSGVSLSNFTAPTANISMGGFTFTSLPSIVLAPTSTSTTPLVANSPSGTSVDVADFQINGTTWWKVTSAGNMGGIGELVVAPTNTSLTPLVINSPTGTSVDIADFQINGTTIWGINSSGTLTGSLVSTTAVPLVVNTPSGSSAAVANFQQNGVTVASVNSSGNLAVTNSQQIDLTAAATSPFLGNAANTYIPVWAAVGGTAPALGNGTKSAKYFKVGRLVTCFIQYVYGSTTTFGTASDAWTFTLPFTAVTPLTSSLPCLGTWVANISGATSNYGGQVYQASTTTISLIYVGATFSVCESVPIAWVASTASTLNINFSYESTT